MHDANKEYFCHQCAKEFKWVQALKQHIDCAHEGLIFSTKIKHINTHKEKEVLKLHTKYLDIMDNQEDVIVTDMETVGSSYTVVDEITKGVTDVEERLARTGAGGRLKRKKDKAQNHGASGQFNLITKRLHNYKMAAKMAAYENWRENTIIIRKDEKMDRCLLLKVHWTMGCLEQRTNLHITWEGSKYGNIVKIRNKNGKYSTCQNVDGKYTKFRDKKILYRGYKQRSFTDIQTICRRGSNSVYHHMTKV